MTETTLQIGAPGPAAGPNDAALAAKLAKANEPPASDAPVAEKPQRPEWVPEKFWDAENGEARVEDLAKSYSELEKGAGKKPAEPAKTAEVPPTDEAKSLVEKAGLNFDTMSEEFVTNGDLTEDSRQKLETAGFSKEMVDTYLAGIKAKGDTLMAAAYEGAETRENFEAMQAWAVANAPEADLNAYNEMVASNDPAKIKLAVQGLMSKYSAAEGTSAERLIHGGAAPSVDTYQSMEQVTADMKKPAYAKDPAFREAVAKKLARSGKL